MRCVALVTPWRDSAESQVQKNTEVTAAGDNPGCPLGILTLTSMRPSDPLTPLRVGMSGPTSGNSEDMGPLMSSGWDPSLQSSFLLVSGDPPPDHDTTRALGGGVWGLSCLNLSGKRLGSATPEQGPLLGHMFAEGRCLGRTGHASIVILGKKVPSAQPWSKRQPGFRP